MIPYGLRGPLILLAGIVLFILVTGDDIDRAALGVGLLFTLSMAGGVASS